MKPWSADDIRSLTAPPSIFERRGVHEMRPQAIAWCRSNQSEASRLPGWDLALLAEVLAPASS